MPRTRPDTSREDVASFEESRRKPRSRFRSPRAAAEWYWEARERMSSPVGLHPRHERTISGEVVATPRVDGGRGSSMDDVLATVHTIGQALAQVGGRNVRGLDMFIRARRDGETQADIAKVYHLDQSSVSRELHRVERAIGLELAGSGLVPDRPPEKCGRRGAHKIVQDHADVEMRPEVGPGARQTAG